MYLFLVHKENTNTLVHSLTGGQKNYSTELGVLERKEREKLERANVILDATEKLFLSKGIDHTTMNDVASESELGKGTLYLYYQSKEELILASTVRGLSILKDYFVEAANTEILGLDQVKAMGMAYFEFAKKYPQYVYVMMYSENIQLDWMGKSDYALECLNMGNDVMGVMLKSIAFGIEDTSIRSNIDPMKTAILLWSFSAGLLQVVNLKGPTLAEQFNVQVDDLTAYFFDYIEHSLKA